MKSWRKVPLVMGLLLLSFLEVERVAGEEARLYEESERSEKLIVRLWSPFGEGAGIITGFENGKLYGVTAKHVVFRGRMAEGIRASFRIWPNRFFPASVVRLHHDPRLDLAVFSVDMSELKMSDAELRDAVPFDQLGRSAELDPGEDVFTIGHSAAGGWLTAKRARPFVGDSGENYFLFESDCPPGHSGGGAFDADWRLVGMIVEREPPYCVALRMEEVVSTVQAWLLPFDLREAGERLRGAPHVGSLKVAVVGFDNKKGHELPNLGLIARDVIGTFLGTIPGLVLLARDRLSDLQQEQQGRSRVDKATERQGLSLEKADVLITGSVLLYEIQQKNVETYGLVARKTVYRMAISIQLVETASGKVKFARSYDVERSSTDTGNVYYPSPADRSAELLSALLAKAEGDLISALMQVASGLDRAGQFILVPLSTSPAGADVILNGVLMGRSPLDLRVEPGIHRVAIELAGYQRWERKVEARPGASIEVTMVRP